MGAIVIGWLFPVFVALLFLGMFGGALSLPGENRYSDFLLPGMLVVTMLFGLETTTLAAAGDAARGVHDRFHSLPVSSAAIVLGRCIADLLNSLIGLTVMVAFGLILGWRPETTPISALLALGSLLWLRFALLWIGISVGYRARSVESVAYVQILVWPIALFSSVFVDPSSMPGWLATVVTLNPVSVTANTVRHLLGGPSWADQLLPVLVGDGLAIAWPAVLVAVFLPLAVRSVRGRK